MVHIGLNFEILENGNLKITATPEGIELLKNERDETSNVWNEAPSIIWDELAEQHKINSSYWFLTADELGAMSEAPCILSERNINDTGNIVIYPDTKGWYFPNYAIIDELAELLDGNAIEFVPMQLEVSKEAWIGVKPTREQLERLIEKRGLYLLIASAGTYVKLDKERFMHMYESSLFIISHIDKAGLNVHLVYHKDYNNYLRDKEKQ